MMSIQITGNSFRLPIITNDEKTISEIVVEILADEWPLTTKGMWRRIRKRYAKEVSFQAVHKAVKKLYAETVLFRSGNYYKINLRWLNAIEKFIITINKNYNLAEVRLNDIP